MPTPYSVLADMDVLVPGASTKWFKAASLATDYAALSTWAAGEIDGILEGHTATPATNADTVEKLAEVEVLLVLHRRVTALYATEDQEASDTFRQSFRGRALGLLSDHAFPASVSVPVKDPAFVGTHNLTVAAFVNAITGRWTVTCNKAGDPNSAGFLVQSRYQGRSWVWDLALGAAFPSVRSAAPHELLHEIRLEISTAGSPEVDFAVGDSWAFWSFGRYKKKRTAGIRMVDTLRGGGYR